MIDSYINDLIDVFEKYIRDNIISNLMYSDNYEKTRNQKKNIL